MTKIIVSAAILLVLASLLACSGPSSIEDLRAAGKEAFLDQEFAKARGYFLTAIAETPSDQDLLYYCGICYQRDFIYDSALYYLKRADLMHPDDRETNLRLYDVSMALGDHSNAIAAINVLANSGDGFEKYYTQLADLYSKNDQPGLAFFWARRALSSANPSPQLYLAAAGWAADFDSIEVAIGLLDSASVKFEGDIRFEVNKSLLLTYLGEYKKAEKLLRQLIAQEGTPPELRLSLANALAPQESRSKKEEALALYEEMYDAMAENYPLDSLMDIVKADLKN